MLVVCKRGALRTGNLKVPRMSVTSIGASLYPTSQPWSAPPGNWQTNRRNDQNTDSAVGNTTNNALKNNVANGAGTNGAGTTATRTNSTNGTNATGANNNGIGTSGAHGIEASDTAGTNATGTSPTNTSNAANDRNPNDNNPLPPVQAATAPGTGQKVNIIA
jgi:hypothetical protein